MYTSHASAPEARLLCVHGSATVGRFWAPLFEAIPVHLDVAMPDRLGCSRGECWPVGAPASFEAEARHLEPYLHAHPEGVHLLAHSYGAAVAMEIALRWPHRVRTLTMYEPSRFAVLFHREDAVDERDQIVSVGRMLISWVVAGRWRDAASMFVDYWSGPGSFQSLDERRQQVIVSNMPKVAAEFEAAFGDTTPTARFAQLDMPVRLLCGSASPAPVRRIVAILADILPNADVVELPGLGHMGPMTHAARVRQHLPEWLVPAPVGEAA
ncbi:alpha/beta fold hydrolase [Variovorax sp. KK3]|uniref:alpha/beta fold hydrolase n=1 Tax=Variovorax sp. KK3 TaxID=1855728 RepID=UPI00097C06DD|nr:alpha/beta hydrolase [Variovorax sp. KK3]